MLYQRLIFVILLTTFSSTVFSKKVVIQSGTKDSYIVTILINSLSYFSTKNYEIILADHNIPKSRVLRFIANNEEIDIIAAGSLSEREKILLPIRLPLLKGLMGWRIPIIHNSKKDIMLNLSLNEFKSLKAGTLHNWSDTKILESNGIVVEKGGIFEGLFGMLGKNRFDYLPLSVLEVSREFEKNKNSSLSIESHSLIHYPTAYYFYVNKNNTELAEDIRLGLEKSFVDGSFDRIFNKYHGKAIKVLENEKRNVFHLENPLLPIKTPIQRKELWINFH